MIKLKLAAILAPIIPKGTIKMKLNPMFILIVPFGIPVKLEEYLVQAVTGGSNDVGKVHIQISKDGVFYYGFGADTDVIYASAMAYVDALNKSI